MIIYVEEKTIKELVDSLENCYTNIYDELTNERKSYLPQWQAPIMQINKSLISDQVGLMREILKRLYALKQEKGIRK